MANTQQSQQMANAIRALAMDAVQQANSGHPGAPMGMADMAVALWSRHLKHNPTNPQWFDRDRFVLSNGHGSMLLYALLHLTGYDLPIGELKNFRQLHSKTPGHPEVGYTAGVETTTGPLGQGITNAVGFALAEKLLAAEFNREGHAVVDHHTYAFLGDGCLMEGISHEAVSLAGAWKLNKLIALYDDNGISIDGQVAPWFADNTPLRFVASGWNVIGPIDGHDADKVAAAIEEAKKQTERPTLIVCKTHIGKGSPNRANTAKAHGEPLGAEEIALTREALGWASEPFVIPEDVYASWDGKANGQSAEAAWNDRFAAYSKAFPELDRTKLEFMGFVQYRTGGEYHLNSPEMAKALHAAVKAGPGYDHFTTYQTLLENRPVTALRDLLENNTTPRTARIAILATLKQLMGPASATLIGRHGAGRPEPRMGLTPGPCQRCEAGADRTEPVQQHHETRADRPFETVAFPLHCLNFALPLNQSGMPILGFLSG